MNDNLSLGENETCAVSSLHSAVKGKGESVLLTLFSAATFFCFVFFFILENKGVLSWCNRGLKLGIEVRERGLFGVLRVV